MTTTMIKMNINLRIKSVDYYGDMFTENVKASKKENNNYIEYNYSSKIGVCKIKLAKDKEDKDYFEMTRDGDSFARLTFNNNGEGVFKLETNGLKKKFNIKNGKINFSLKNICFSYEIFEDEEIINTLVINIIEE
ncbi:MAG: hypothetical protein ACRC6K_07690 [Fusobacteriaceae bacterium]